VLMLPLSPQGWVTASSVFEARKLPGRVSAIAAVTAVVQMSGNSSSRAPGSCCEVWLLLAN
jgi:hypothetical protein